MGQVPRVFISYSHDSTAHDERVLALANALRCQGIDAVIDQYEPYPPEGWPLWMERQIDQADFVLLVITANYRNRFDGKVPLGKGAGVPWESNVLRNKLYKGVYDNSKFIPVMLDTAVEGFVPDILGGVNHYLLQNFKFDGGGYEQLYRRLTDQPLVAKPELGVLAKLPERDRLPVAVRSATQTPVAGLGETVSSEPNSDVPQSGQPTRQATVPTRQELVLYIDRDFDQYSPADQERLLAAINALAGIKEGLRIVKVQAGSVKVTLEGSTEDVVRVLQAFYMNELSETGVVAVEYRGSKHEISRDQPRPHQRQPDATRIDHVVLVVYGIRDVGKWQQKVGKMIDGVAGLKSVRVQFGYYDALSFVSIFGNSKRPYQVLLRAYTDARDRYPNAKISVIAHSFGTWLVGQLIEKHPGLKLHRIILCGSVMREDYPWSDYADKVGVGVPETQMAILNECGDADIWPAVAKAASSRYGSVGRYGFNNDVHVVSRWFTGGHGCFFSIEHMRSNWLPFLQHGIVPTGDTDIPAPLWYERLASTFAFGQLWFLSIAFLMLVRLLVPWLVLVGIFGLLYLIWLWISPWIAHRIKAASSYPTRLNITVDNKAPTTIGPSSMRVLDHPEFIEREWNWDPGEGPRSDEDIFLPTWGKYRLKCTVNLVDPDSTGQRPSQLSVSQGALPVLPNARYQKDIEINEDHEWVDLTAKELILPKARHP